MIPLALIQAAGLPEPEPVDLQAVLDQEEKNWAEIGNISGTWYSDPSCLEPMEEPDVG